MDSEVSKAPKFEYHARSTDPFVQKEIDRFGEKDIIENGLGLLYCKDLHKKIYDIEDLAVFMCEIMGCQMCPVHNQNFDLRVTESDKEGLVCCVNLYEWIIEQSLKEAKKRLDEYRRTVVYEPIESEKEE